MKIKAFRVFHKDGQQLTLSCVLVFRKSSKQLVWDVDENDAPPVAPGRKNRILST